MSGRRVLLCTDYLPPSDGGVEQVVQTLATRLAKRGDDVAVFTLDRGDEPTLADHDGVTVYRADTVDLTETIGLQSTVSVDALLEFRRVLADFEPDLVHVHNRFFFTSYVGGLLYGLRFDGPVVATMHLGPIDEIDGVTGLAGRIVERTFGRLLLRRADHVLAVSGAVADHGRALSVPESDVTVARNAVELEEFPERSPDDKDVAFVGRLIKNNGPVEFLEAGARVLEDHPDAHLHLVGTGVLRDDLEELADSLGVADSVTFHGFLEDVADAYELADVFCRPSYSEGLPLTVLESMASGVPPVVSDIAGVPEVVDDGETGRLVQPGDVEGIANALSWLLEDPDRHAAVGRAAREHAEAELSWTSRVRQVLSVYDSVLEP